MLPERMNATGRVKAPIQQQEAANSLDTASDPDKGRHRRAGSRKADELLQAVLDKQERGDDPQHAQHVGGEVIEIEKRSHPLIATLSVKSIFALSFIWGLLHLRRRPDAALLFPSQCLNSGAAVDYDTRP